MHVTVVPIVTVPNLNTKSNVTQYCFNYSLKMQYVMLQLFLNTVIVSDAVFEKRLQQNPSTDDLLHCALREDICST